MGKFRRTPSEIANWRRREWNSLEDDGAVVSGTAYKSTVCANRV